MSSSFLPPKISAEVRAKAVANAALSRRTRAEVKEGLSAGKLSFFQILNDPRQAIQRMRVKELLSAVAGIGPTRCETIMVRNAISPSRRLGGLGRHQLLALGKESALLKVDTPPGSLIVMSGPGGVGKSTITSALRTDPRFWVSVSATTRAPRASESNGVDYFFLSEQKFTQMVAAGEFLEWAEFAGARYGTPKHPIQEWRAIGKHVLLEIEIEGARQVRSADPSALLIFIAPPSWEELQNRLAARGSDSAERQAARLALGAAEMAAATEFDHTLVNSQVEDVVAQLVALATSHQVS